MSRSRKKPHSTGRGIPRKPQMRKGQRVYKPKETARG